MRTSRQVVGVGALVAVTVLALGCASATSSDAFGSASGVGAAVRKPGSLGTYPASPAMTSLYGIAEWRTFMGKSQMVVTGYRADGSAARGVQVAWFPTVPGAVGHTRLLMLDGSATSVRRMVGGASSGALSQAQEELVQTMRYDLQRAGAASGTSVVVDGLHVLGAAANTSPGTGPGCFEAWADPSIAVDGVGCASGAATFETVIGGVVAILSCAQWYAEAEAAQGKCDAEDAASCNTDTPPTCNFGGADAGAAAPAMPAPACDTACLCANYPTTAQGCGTVGPCSYDTDCGSGETCQPSMPGASSKVCGPPAAASDNVTDKNLTSGSATAPSCGSGDLVTDPGTGAVSCASATPASPTTGPGAVAAPDAGGNPAATGSDPTDPGTDAGVDPGVTCANDGSGCAADADCCSGSCVSAACGGSAGSDAGAACANDGSGCAQDADCCGGSCAAGTCGSSTSTGTSDAGATCASDGAGCSQDADCCGGACSSGTCGVGAASGTPDAAPACASDGAGCSQDADCCGGTCSSGTCGAPAAPACGNPGDGCAQDADCCSGSCDPTVGSCN